LAWLPSSLLILLYLLSTPKRAGQAASDYPCIAAEKLGPLGTIAKVQVERKEKSQKRLEKCRFLAGPLRKERWNAGAAHIGDANSAVTAVTGAESPFE
jgi:hypothetical protein